ncbi:MAG: SAM-dependent chlorinase/fluorinase, partial [Myxococcota bacterium]
MKRTFTLLATCIFGVLAASQAFATTPNIVFISDFGLADDSVSQCKAVILDVAPETHVIDMTHGVVPYDIRFAAFLLADSAGYWPPGTVFLAVVDPGVGTDRKRVAIKTKSGRYFVGPDNGIFSIVARLHGIEKAVYIENMKYARTSVSSTFEGRDVFAPVAAWLIRDPAVFDRLGPVV